MSLTRVIVDVVADEAGAFAPVALPAIHGILVALETDPGPPELTDGFHVRVDDGHRDVLAGAGERRSGHVLERTVIRFSPLIPTHPFIDARVDALTLRISGNGQPRAKLRVGLIVAVGEGVGVRVS
jgi:hypothetical protein